MRIPTTQENGMIETPPSAASWVIYQFLTGKIDTPPNPQEVQYFMVGYKAMAMQVYKAVRQPALIGRQFGDLDLVKLTEDLSAMMDNEPIDDFKDFQEIIARMIVERNTERVEDVQ